LAFSQFSVGESSAQIFNMPIRLIWGMDDDIKAVLDEQYQTKALYPFLLVYLEQFSYDEEHESWTKKTFS